MSDQRPYGLVHDGILAGCAFVIASAIWMAVATLKEYAPKKIAADGGVEAAIRELTAEVRAGCKNEPK